jgi:exodeoxyribonuclease VII small subunit
MASEPSSEHFETVYRRLEEIVTTMEAGGLSLEEALALYEEGMQLYKRCQEMLSSAQLRITQLQNALLVSEDGPFSP